MNHPYDINQDQEKLRQILNSKEFKAYHTGGQNFLGRWIENLIQWLSKLFPNTPIPTGTGRVISNVIMAIFLFLLILSLVWIIREIIRTRKIRRDIPLTSLEIEKSYTFFLGQANQWMNQGDAREAVRNAFLSFLFYLQYREWIKVEQWKTNWEYAQELQENQSALNTSFRDSARFFEQVWYGWTQPDMNEVRAYIGHVENLLREEKESAQVQ